MIPPRRQYDSSDFPEQSDLMRPPVSEAGLPLNMASLVPSMPDSESLSECAKKVEKLARLKELHTSARDETEFENFCSEYNKPLYYYIRKSVIDARDAEEILQDTFVEAWKSWDDIKEYEEKHKRNWLYKVARNKMHDFWRRLKSHLQHWTADCFRCPTSEGQSQASLGDDLEATERMLYLLSKLSRRERECIELTFQGFTICEIASILRIKESTVRASLTHGRKKYAQAQKELKALSD